SVKTVDENIVIVVGHQAEKVKEVISEKLNIKYAYQEKQLGTGHAVKCAMAQISDELENIIILCGDTPLITSETLTSILDEHFNRNLDMTILTAKIEDPESYGRIIQNSDGNVINIVEETDATNEQKKINLINSGIYCVKKDCLNTSLNKIKSDNVQGEYYLPDIVEILEKGGKKIGFLNCKDINEVTGVNSNEDLIKAEKLMKYGR
ncbi:MAG: NTP transferase domain-containing protein, partial [bacterium]|nr:NTP transferase domain-containing protein [bacterium]